MRLSGSLPKSVMISESIGMALLVLAWLSLNGYLTLPAPFNASFWSVALIFAGVLLMVPAAFVLLRGVAQRLAPQLLPRDRHSSSTSDREKHDDADH